VPRIDRTKLADNTIRAVAVITVSGLTLIAARTSYQHMLLLAERHGVLGIDAHSFPLTVDGLDVIGVLVLLADRRTSRRPGPIPWLVLAVGTLASLTANIAVAPDNLVARAISGWTAIALLAAAKMLSHLFEPQDPAGAVNQPAADTTTVDQPHVDRSNTEPETVPAQPAEPPQPNGDIARRLPTSGAALARWRSIWAAVRHLETATADSAAAHQISLRILQFIRAAGGAGHLEPHNTVAAGPQFVRADQTEPIHHDAIAGAVT
jgi:hypothetical protein